MQCCGVVPAMPLEGCCNVAVQDYLGSLSSALYPALYMTRVSHQSVTHTAGLQTSSGHRHCKYVHAWLDPHRPPAALGAALLAAAACGKAPSIHPTRFSSQSCTCPTAAVHSASPLPDPAGSSTAANRA